jgi:hypothetical protein
MALDTRPNLDNNKFEQFSGDTLSLSGTNEIYGSLSVKSGAILNIESGATTGYVLTSDSSGNALWQNVPIDIVGYTCDLNDSVSIATCALPYTVSSGVTNNIAIGRNALCVNSGGTNNVAVGISALRLSTDGVSNIAIGYYSLASNCGNQNIAIGQSPLRNNGLGSDNIAIGYRTMCSNDTGNDNIALGRAALYNNTTGCFNIASGCQALHNNTTGCHNIASGNQALYSNTGGSYNIASGNQALCCNTTGDFNIASGYQALLKNTTGCFNIASGYQALCCNTTGNFNIASGYQALLNNTTGNDNIASGYYALYSNTGGSNNIASGSRALYRNTTGRYNIASGCRALFNNTGGSDNVASGSRALYNNTTGCHNIASGTQALHNNTTCCFNIASGCQALYNNTTGSNNIASGCRALYNNTTGSNNIASGNLALYSNTGGTSNIAIGCNALNDNTSGSRNVAIGLSALGNNVNGCENIAVGCGAILGANGSNGCFNIALGIYSMQFLQDGGFNVGVGRQALRCMETGFCNVAVGNNALETNCTGSDNVAIGRQTGQFNTTGSSNVFIGNQAGYQETGSDRLYITNTSTTTPLIYGEFDNDLLCINGELQTQDFCTNGVTEFGGKATYYTGFTFTSDCDLVDKKYVDNAISAATSGASYSFTNGLNESGGVVKLGGSVNENTTLSVGGGNSFSICDGLFFNVHDFTLYTITGTSGNVLACGTLGLGILSGGTCSQFDLSSACNKFIDEFRSEGLVYEADYSAVGSQNPRWIPDAAWVTGETSNALSAADNGLTANGSTVELGGVLDKNTCISGPFDLRITGVTLTQICASTLALQSSAFAYLGVGDSNSGQYLCVTTNCMTVYDDINSEGLVYESDYSAVGGTNPRWIPDAAWVTGQTPTVSASGENIKKEVSQSSHGFSVQDFIGWSGGTYNKAIADGTYDGEFIGLVTEVPDVNTFCVTQAGYVTGLTSLVASTTYFLSETTAGLLTDTAPTGDTEIAKAILVADSTTTGWVLPYPGAVISTGGTGGGSVSALDNGLTLNGATGELGGTLCKNTSILGAGTYDLCLGTSASKLDCLVIEPAGCVDINGLFNASNGNGGAIDLLSDRLRLFGGTTNLSELDLFDTGEFALSFKGSAGGGISDSDAYGLCYGGDYSANSGTNPRWIPDAAWVTGQTSGGGGDSNLKWTGSTANAIGTYISASGICAQPNLTFDGSTLSVTGVASISGGSGSAGLNVLASSNEPAAEFTGDEDATGTEYAVGIFNRGTGTGQYTGLIVSTCSPTAEAEGRSYAIRAIAGNRTTQFNIGAWGRIEGTNDGAGIVGDDGTYGKTALPAGTWAQVNYGDTYLCGCAFITENLCFNGGVTGDIHFGQGIDHQICVAEATDGGNGDSLSIIAGLGDSDATPGYGGCLRLIGGSGGDNTSTGNGGDGCYVFVYGGSGGDANSGTAGTGGRAILRGGPGGGAQNAGDGGEAQICGGVGGPGASGSGAGGNVVICGGAGDTNTYGCVLIYNDTTLRFATTSNGTCTVGVACASTCFRSPRYCATTAFCTTGFFCGTGTGYKFIASAGCGCAVDWVATSDIRKKKNITPISSALSTVDALCGVCYDFCDDDETPDMGLIAQDVVKVEPRLVTISEPDESDIEKYGITDEVYGLKYDKFAGLFVEAIKELKEQNQCLQNQINALREKIN